MSYALHEAIGIALAASPGVVSAYLFGSAAAGREHRESDIDLGVLLNRQLLPHAADHAHLRTMLSRAADIEPFLRQTRAVKLAALTR